MKKSLSILCLIAFVTGGSFPFQDSVPKLTGPYLGQKPPSLKSEIFAPGIISTEISEGCSGWGNEMEYFVFQRWFDGKSKIGGRDE